MKLSNPVCVQLYIPRDEKEAFKKACFQSDETMSQALRKMIREYIRNPPTIERLYYEQGDSEE